MDLVHDNQPAPLTVEILPAVPDTNPAEFYLASLRDSRSQRQALRKIAEFLSPNSDETNYRWTDVMWEDVQRVRNWLVKEEYSFNTTNKCISAIRGVLECAWQLGLITYDEFQRRTKVKRAKGKRLLAGRHVQHREIGSLFETMSADKRRRQGIRDAAILALLYGAGPRRAEVTALELEHVEVEGDRTFIKVLGKGDKHRRIPLPQAVADAVHNWIKVRGDKPGPLFPSIRPPKRIHPQTIHYILKRAAERGRVKHLSPHDLRRTMITDLSDAMVPLTVIQGIAGHADVSTTARYTRHEELARMLAVDKLVVPYHVDKP